MEKELFLTTDLLQAFLASLSEKGLGRETCQRTEAHLMSLRRLIGEDAPLTSEGLSRWEESLSDLTERSRKRYLASANQFLRYAGFPSLCFLSDNAVRLEGMRFGRLTVLGKTGERTADRGVIWRCRCDCGREIEVPAAKLLCGRVRSCGCYKLEKLQKANGYVDNTCLSLVLSDKVRSDNTSGTRGVYRKRDRWMARIQYKGKIYSLGTYRRKEDAVKARKEAEARVKDDAEKLLREKIIVS